MQSELQRTSLLGALELADGPLLLGLVARVCKELRTSADRHPSWQRLLEQDAEESDLKLIDAARRCAGNTVDAKVLYRDYVAGRCFVCERVRKQYCVGEFVAASYCVAPVLLCEPCMDRRQNDHVITRTDARRTLRLSDAELADVPSQARGRVTLYVRRCAEKRALVSAAANKKRKRSTADDWTPEGVKRRREAAAAKRLERKEALLRQQEAADRDRRARIEAIRAAQHTRRAELTAALAQRGLPLPPDCAHSARYISCGPGVQSLAQTVALCRTEHERRAALTAALAQRGITLRSDTIGCGRYIRGDRDALSLEQTVELVDETRFLHEQTDYYRTLAQSQRLHGAQQQERLQSAKRDALKGWVAQRIAGSQTLDAILAALPPNLKNAGATWLAVLTKGQK